MGAGVFLALHVFFALTWDSLFQPATLRTPWFLGSKAAILVTQVAMGLVALGFAWSAADWRIRLTELSLTIVGAMAAAATLFFVLGPANLMVGPTHLWPVALASAVLLVGPAILAGTLLGGTLHSLASRQR